MVPSLLKTWNLEKLRDYKKFTNRVRTIIHSGCHSRISSTQQDIAFKRLGASQTNRFEHAKVRGPSHCIASSVSLFYPSHDVVLKQRPACEGIEVSQPESPLRIHMRSIRPSTLFLILFALAGEMAVPLRVEAQILCVGGDKPYFENGVWYCCSDRRCEGEPLPDTCNPGERRSRYYIEKILNQSDQRECKNPVCGQEAKVTLPDDYERKTEVYECSPNGTWGFVCLMSDITLYTCGKDEPLQCTERTPRGIQKHEDSPPKQIEKHLYENTCALRFA